MSTEEQNPKPIPPYSPPPEKEANPWLVIILCLVFSAGLVFLAHYFYNDLARMERMGGTRRMNVILVLMYDILGKGGVYWFFMILSGVLAAVSANTLIKTLRKR